MLYGAVPTIFTDHKNLTFRTLLAQHVLRWRMYLKDFDVNFKYIEEKKKVLADSFSRLPRMEKASVGKSPDKGTLIDFKKLEVPKDEDEVFHCNEFPNILSSCDNSDPDMIECFRNLPALTEMQCPINLNRMQLQQTIDAELTANCMQRLDLYPVKEMTDGTLLICFRECNTDPNWRIALPAVMVKDMV